MLVILLDPTDMQESGYREQLDILERELAEHSAELAARPRLVVIGKIDAYPDLEECRRWAEQRRIELYSVSSVTGEGLGTLVHAVADLVDEHVREAPERAGYVLHRPLHTDFEVARDRDGWVVSGRAAERAVNLDDLTRPEAADFVARRLARIGVDAALRDAGAKAGDDVRIGGLTFTFEPDESPDEAAEA